MKETILRDRNEQRPWKFPKTIKWYRDRSTKGQIVLLREQRKVLKAGDYCLKGEEESCLIERKASLKELANNLVGDDYSRAMDAFRRFSEATRHPYLAVECTVAELRNPTRWVQEPARIVDALCSLMERLHFRLILVGKCVDLKQKRNVGEFMVRLMLAHKYQQEEDLSCDTAINKLLSTPEQLGTIAKEKDDQVS